MNRLLLLALLMSVSIHVRLIHLSYVLVKGSCYLENDMKMNRQICERVLT